MRRCGQGEQKTPGNKHYCNNNFTLSKTIEGDNPISNVNVTSESKRMKQVGCKSAWGRVKPLRRLIFLLTRRAFRGTVPVAPRERAKNPAKPPLTPSRQNRHYHCRQALPAAATQWPRRRALSTVPERRRCGWARARRPRSNPPRGPMGAGPLPRKQPRRSRRPRAGATRERRGRCGSCGGACEAGLGRATPGPGELGQPDWGAAARP